MNEVQFTYSGEEIRFDPETLNFHHPDEAPFRPATVVPSPPPRAPQLHFVTLNIAHDCNMACPYCFAKQGLYGGPRKLMTPEVARRAVDWLLEVSGDHRMCYLRFLGGEPLMNVAVMRDAMAHARRRAAELDKEVQFSVNTNGTLWNDEIADILAENQVTISISMDGGREAHNRFRIFNNCRGTYDTVVKHLPKILACDPMAMVNATLTADTLDVDAHADCFRQLGFRLIRFVMVGTSDPGIAVRQEEHLAVLREAYHRLARRYLDDLLAGEIWYLADIYKYIPNLLTGRGRANRCGAGTSYVNLDVEGEVHLCHRFTADATQRIGSVDTGLPQVPESITGVYQIGSTLPSVPSGKPISGAAPRFIHRHLNGAPFLDHRGSLALGANPCSRCDIRSLCGGYCFHDGEMLFGDLHGGPDGFKCEIDRHLARITLWMLLQLGHGHPIYDQLLALHHKSIQHTD